ncbi:MAG: hypothetical protein IIZ51_11735 [Lachnospiraceae bacterium]|nr:hypothetical protein [Lachnospiraceae bacterium]MBQ1516510.1 hypothetical protein [Lachnospiraceae bacterium]
MKWDNYFFVIDSEHLDDVESGLFGYCCSEDGTVFMRGDPGLRPEDVVPSGLGSYDLIVRGEDHIDIYQDLLGSQGIYIYEDGGYYALSNSCLYLMEYLKPKRSFRIDRDFAYHFVPEVTGVYTCSETMIREIRLIDRDLTIRIDLSSARISYERVAQLEDTEDVDTREGIAVLDRWMERWGNIIRKVYSSDGDIEFDLSGGFDSRMSLLIGLNAGIDMSSVMVRSLNDHLSCHDEDYRIAEMIAEICGFRLNDPSVFRYRDIPFDMPEIHGISMYTKGLSHKQMYYKPAFHDHIKYRVTGAGGENRRADKHHRSPADLLKERIRLSRYAYSEPLKAEAEEIQKRVMDRMCGEVSAALGDRDDTEEQLSRRIFMDTSSRYHFAYDMFECYMANEIKILPLLDPELMKLKRKGRKGDMDLLMALIFTRYGGRLADVPFEGGRIILPETLEYARELNEKYPRKSIDGRELLTRERVRTGGPEKNLYGKVSAEDEIFDAGRILAADSRIRESFCRVFDEDTYYLLFEDSFRRKFRPLQMLHGAIGVGLSEWYAEESAKGNTETFLDIMESVESSGCLSVMAGMTARTDQIRKELKQTRETLFKERKEHEALKAGVIDKKETPEKDILPERPRKSSIFDKLAKRKNNS